MGLRWRIFTYIGKNFLQKNEHLSIPVSIETIHQYHLIFNGNLSQKLNWQSSCDTQTIPSKVTLNYREH